MVHTDLDARVDAVRRFNRLYTRQLGLLQEGYLDTPYSLSEVRVLYELAHRASATATLLATELGLDAGYLSRILRRFQQQGFISKQPSAHDGRQMLIHLTPDGENVVAALERRSRDDIARMLEQASPDGQQHLVAAMSTISSLLDPASGPQAPFLVRSHRPGDLGWIVSRHASLYAQEFGWDGTFEAVVAKIAAEFLDHFDPRCEHCWIAERDGCNIGSIALVRDREHDGVAKLRLLLVEPSARGLGVGRYLVDECLRFARSAGYHRVSLGTYAHLTSALRLYQRAGFHLVHEAPQQAYGQDLVEQTWELAL